jgi:glycosyltransferase involved in cell wall biosynthesis
MKHICFFNTIQFWGGGEKIYFEYAVGFQKLGYRVSMVCSENSMLSKKADQAGLACFYVSSSNLSFLNPFKQQRLIHFFKKENVDTVMFSASQDLKLGGIAAHLAGVRQIVYRRGLAAPIKNRPLNRFLLGKATTHLIANSEETKKMMLVNLDQSFPADKIRIVHNGLKIEAMRRHPYRKIHQIEKYGHGIILGNAGRLTPQKGHQYLIHIASKLKERKLDFTLFIAGSGPLKSDLEKEIIENDLTNEVFLLDFVDDIPSFMRSIDVFVLSSIWEGFGFVLAEAMVFEKPIVAFDITSNPEVVKDGETGYLVPFKELDVFADRLESFINDEPLRKEFGEAGRKRVEANFEFNLQLKKLEHILFG